MSEVLDGLYKEKAETSDKIELRKIRAKIRKELRNAGQYTKQTRFSRAPKERKQYSDEELGYKRAKRERRKRGRERIAGREALTFWKSLKVLHGETCGCSECVRDRIAKTKGIAPPLKAWTYIIKRRGFEVDDDWVETSYKRLRDPKRTGRPKTSKGQLLDALIDASGW